MDIAIALDRLVPAAEYEGSLTDNLQSQYDSLVWLDERTKPSWQDIEDEWIVYLSQLNSDEYKIYDWVLNYRGDKNIMPVRIDFLTGLTKRLHPKHTFVFGELTQTIYYSEATLNQETGAMSYAVPVVKESFAYTRDEAGFPVYRKNEIQWYFCNGDLDTNKKTLEKYYADDAISTLNELARRRDNNIKNIIGAIIHLAMLTTPNVTKIEIIEQGRGFFNNSSTSRDLYIHDGNLTLVDDVRNDATISWFDNDVQALVGLGTIRSFIIYQLTMGTETS